MPVANSDGDPWNWLQPYDAKRFGEVILDRTEQERWSRAILLGGLPFMWAKAAVVRNLMFDALQLRENDRVLVLGECIESCNFTSDIQQRIGPKGQIQVIDITEDARNAYFAGKRGSGGRLATWRYDYTSHYADEYFDCVAVLQGVQHAEDWSTTAKELLRVMKPGRRILLAEITFGPNMLSGIESDVHVEYVFAKIASRLGFALQDIPYYSPAAIIAAFDGLVANSDHFEWRGIELFWGGKPD